MRIDVEDVLKLPRCPVCGPQKNPYRPIFPTQSDATFDNVLEPMGGAV